MMLGLYCGRRIALGKKSQARQQTNFSTIVARNASRWAGSRSLQLLLRELAKRVGDGTGLAEHNGAISDGLPAPAIPDRVDRAVRRPARGPASGAGPASFVGKAKR